MKKLTLGLAVLLAGFAANSLAALPTGNNSPCAVSVPNYCGGFTFGLTGLWWRATSPQQNFGITFDNFDFVLNEVDDTEFFTFDGFGGANDHHHRHDYDWGFQANVGYIFPCSGNDVRLTYTHWDNNDHHHFRDGVVLTAGQIALLNDPLVGPVLPLVDETTFFAILPLIEVLDPEDGFELTDISTRIAAKTDIENHTWDLDFGQTINVGCNFGMRWFAGLRYSHLEHKLNTAIETTITGFADDFTIEGDDLIPLSDDDISGATEIDTAVDLTVTDFFHHRSKFNGIGPRFGFDVSYNVACGFGVVGSLSTSLLVGEVDSTFAERVALVGTFATDGGEGLEVNEESVEIPESVINFTADTGPITFHHPDETRVVPNIDAKLGVDYTYQFCNCSRSKLTVEAGYYVSHYFNAVDRLTDFGFDDPAFGDRRTIDLSFDGPYLSVQVAL